MENVAGEQDLYFKIFRKFKLSYKLTLSFQGAQIWPIWYFQCALSISGILEVIAHNIKIL